MMLRLPVVAKGLARAQSRSTCTSVSVGIGLVDAAHIAIIFSLQAKADCTGPKRNQIHSLFLALYLSFMDRRYELFGDYLETQRPPIEEQAKRWAQWRRLRLDIDKQRVKMLTKCVNK